jgi:predicted amidohydrolase
MEVPIYLAQFEPSLNVSNNLQTMLRFISTTTEGDIVVMPEGCLSGYSHNLNFLDIHIAKDVEQAIKELQQISINQNIHLVFGSCIFETENWYNAGIYISPEGKKHIYKKVNLAIHEREFLKMGNELSCFDIEYGGKKIKCAIQLCREIRFPEQWKLLSLDGAEIIFYLTNVIGSEQFQVWNSHLISRAAENQRYIVSSNIADKEQGCSSMVISPKGKIIKELLTNVEAIERIKICLTKNSNLYLSQGRSDLVKVVSK